MYVDGILMSGNGESYIASVKKYLKKGFEMKDLGNLHYYLGIKFTQHRKYISISQKKYNGEILNILCITKCNPLPT